jgi:hypothetical protein
MQGARYKNDFQLSVVGFQLKKLNTNKKMQEKTKCKKVQKSDKISFSKCSGCELK